MTGKVAIVTGGASGIGLALANDLHSKGWKVAIIDMNTSQGEEAVSKLGKDSAIFIKADVSKWEQNVSFFKTVKQKFGRIDFVAANAGIDDSQDLYNPASADGVTKPNYKTIEVDLYGPLYATQLALHYFRTNSPNTGGKIVVTSSAAGLYGSPAQPQYGVAKFGLIGLTRSMGGNKGLLKENITINAICPSFVRTGLAPKDLVKIMDEKFPHLITPVETIVKAFNMFIDDDSMSGQVAECILENVYIREGLPIADKSRESVGDEVMPYFEAAYEGKLGHRGAEFANV